MPHTFAIGLLGLGAALTLGGSALQGKPKPVRVEERTFLQDAALDDMLEVRLGELALQRTERPDVAHLAKQLVAEHAEEGAALAQLAKKKGVALPPNLDPARQAVLDRLGELHGEAFDRGYVVSMWSDHKHDVGEFETEKDATGGDAEVRRFATDVLAVLRRQLVIVTAIHVKMISETKTY